MGRGASFLSFSSSSLAKKKKKRIAEEILRAASSDLNVMDLLYLWLDGPLTSVMILFVFSVATVETFCFGASAALNLHT